MNLAPEEIVRVLAARGVILETRGDRLRWRAPCRGVLTRADVDLLRQHKRDILNLLRRQEEADALFGPIAESERAMDRTSRISWVQWRSGEPGSSRGTTSWISAPRRRPSIGKIVLLDNRIRPPRIEP